MSDGNGLEPSPSPSPFTLHAHPHPRPLPLTLTPTLTLHPSPLTPHPHLSPSPPPSPLPPHPSPSPLTLTLTPTLTRSLLLDEEMSTSLPGGVLQLIALLPSIVESASAADPEWQLVQLSAPWPASHPHPHPHPLEGTGWVRVGTSGACASDACASMRALGCVYRAPLMRALLASLETVGDLPRDLPRDRRPLDVRVCEVMASHGLLEHALRAKRPLLAFDQAVVSTHPPDR